MADDEESEDWRGRTCHWDGLALGGSSRVMPYHTLSLTTVLQTHTVDNIINIQFLHGFNQPTLLKMYEPLKTQAGKIAVRKDMCRLDMVTMDVKEKLQPLSGQEKFSPLTV